MTYLMKENTDFRFLIEQAIKAPSGHNTQPWLFKINENSIDILPDKNKRLPVVDPNDRELFISLGCATENLCIAARTKGYQPKINISEDGEINIQLLNTTSTQTNEETLTYIAKRQANRSVYDGNLLTEKVITGLSNNIHLEDGINIRLYQRNTPEFDQITDFIVAGNTQQMQDPAFVEELKSWMRFNKKHLQETGNGLSYAVFGAPNLPLFIVKPIMSSYLNPNTQNKGDIKKIQSSSHFVLFTVQSNRVSEWIQLGRSLQRFLLELTRQNIAHAHCNQPCEVKELSDQMAHSLNLTDEYPALLLRIGYAKPVSFSPRESIDKVIITL